MSTAKTTDDTSAKVEEIRQRLRDAVREAPYPWAVDNEDGADAIASDVLTSEDGRETIATVFGYPGECDARVVAAFIAHAPEDIAFLLGELERVREMGGEAIALLTREVSRLEEQRDRLRVEVERLRRERDGEVWLWMGGGTDDVESLACPVLMSAEQVRALTAHGTQLEAANTRLTSEVEALREACDASFLRGRVAGVGVWAGKHRKLRAEFDALVRQEAKVAADLAVLQEAVAHRDSVLQHIAQTLGLEDVPPGYGLVDEVKRFAALGEEGLADHVLTGIYETCKGAGISDVDTETGGYLGASQVVRMLAERLEAVREQERLRALEVDQLTAQVAELDEAAREAEQEAEALRGLVELIHEHHLLECAEEMVGGAECSCTRRTTAALEEIRAFIAVPRPDPTDLLAELGEVRVRFGLDAQGHVPTIERMLAEGADWQAIGAAINWDPATAQTHWSAREAKLREATEPKTLTLDDLRPLMVEGWEMPEAPEENLPRGPLQPGAIWVEGFGWDLRWCWADGVPTSHLIPDPFRDDVTCTAEMLQALGFTVEAG